MIRWSLVSAIVALLSFASPGSAPCAPSSQGRVEFEKATRYFQAGEYEAALPYYEKAYELSNHRPSAIRALAQCERALKMYERAKEHFVEYLATRPKPKDAAAIEETIGLIDDLIKEAKNKEAKGEPKKAEAEAPPLPPPASVPKPSDSIPPALVQAPEPTATTPLQSTTSAPEPGSSFWSGPVPWIIGGAVVAIGGGIALAFALRSSGGDVYPGTSGVILQR